MALAESRARKRQLGYAVAIALGCWLLISVAYLAGVFEAFDVRLLDWRFRLRGERRAPDAIALVGIDDATIRGYGGWPLPRDSYALLLTALEEAGARAVGIDLQFPADKNKDPRLDALLAYVAGEHGNIVPAMWFHADGAQAPGDPVPDAETLAALRGQGVVAPGVDVPEAASVSLPFSGLVLASKAMGHITVAADRDGAIRRQPFLVRYEDRVYASLALRMAGAARGFSGPPQARMARSGVRVGWPRGPSWTLPLDREGSTRVDFAGDRAAFPHAYSMLDAMQWHRAGDLSRLRDAFGGRLVLIGLDSQKEVTEDVGTTPFASATPLLFVHANALENLLRDRFLGRPGAAVYLSALAAMALGLGWLFAIWPLPIAAGVLAFVLAAIAGFDFALFAIYSIDVPPVAALLLGPAIYGAIASHRYVFLERRSREREVDIREGRSVQQQFLPEALVGQTLSHYRIVEKLGMGGMGVVYLARDERLGRDVAVKVLPGRALADEKARRRFRNEALALSKLNHPNIASIYDFDSQDGTDFIVMEYVSGTLLSQRVREGPMPEQEALQIATQVVEALGEAHAHGVVHRDLKPENIKLTERGEAKVLDFGLAQLGRSATDATATMTQSLTVPGQIMGTLPYLAPEMLRGEKTGPWSDLYSFGVVLFEMATGRRPFPDDDPHELMYTIAHQPPPPPRVLNARISTGLEAAILRALEKDPAQRYPSAAAFAEDLRRLQGAAVAAGPEQGKAVEPGV